MSDKAELVIWAIVGSIGGAIYYIPRIKEWLQKHQCPNCGTRFQIEVLDSKITNKRRQFAGYKTQALDRAKGTRTRQVRKTTEYLLEDCQCTACGHEFERKNTYTYES